MENNNNLFTNMFGMESEEQPVTATPVPEPQPVQEPISVPSVEPVGQTIKPSIQIEQPAIEEIIVLDSNPQPIEQQPQVVEEPTLNSINSNPKEIQKNNNDYEEFSVPKENIYKPICIILGITLLIVVLAFPLYNVVNNYLYSTKEPEVKNEQPTPQEEPKTEEKPVTPALNIEFDINAKFDKGYTKTVTEYHQTSSFKPASSEGVIKCENIKPLVHTGGQNNTVVYIYYKDYMAKKLLTIDDIDLNNATSYSQYINSFQTITAVTDKNEHLFTQLLVDAKSYRIKYHMLVDLAYSQATRLPDSDYYIDISLSYNSPIQSAMNKFLGNKNYIGNMYCSTIITEDASL